MKATFDNSYARLPEQMFRRENPVAVAAPNGLAINADLADDLGISYGSDWPDYISGNKIPEGAAPLTQAYSGHQFGHWNPQLGDGRAHLLGEILASDHRYDLQLKGSGRTSWSRGGDGRAWIGPVLREFLVSEAMHALNVPTTRALAMVSTGEAILREDGPLPGAVLARVASSHIRVGTFQYFASRGDTQALQALFEHTVERHYPDAKTPADLLTAAVQAQAKLVAQWMGLGFIHGVMNTDNSHVGGITIDYGPCAFMDGFHPMKVFSSIDRKGRYAFGNQPNMAAWNMAQLATALLPLMPDRDAAVEEFTEAVHQFSPAFSEAYRNEYAAKLGLEPTEQADDLIDDFLALLAETGADYTQTFARFETDLGEDALGGTSGYADWKAKWQDRATQTPRNPQFIPRNHLVQSAIDGAVSGDLSLFHDLWEAGKAPFTRPDDPSLTAPPHSDQVVQRTFCGT